MEDWTENDFKEFARFMFSLPQDVRTWTDEQRAKAGLFIDRMENGTPDGKEAAKRFINP